MSIFSQHPLQQGISYWQHLQFAMGIANRLFKSVIASGVHAIFPFFNIHRELDLEETASFMLDRSQWIESRKQEKQQIQLHEHLDDDNPHQPFKIISV